MNIKRAYQDPRNDIQAKVVVSIPEGCSDGDVARFLAEVSADLLTQFDKVQD